MMYEMMYNFSEEIPEDVLKEFENGIEYAINGKYVGNHKKELLILCMKELIRLYFFHKKNNDPIRTPYGFAITITEGYIKEFEENEFNKIAIEYLKNK